MARASKPNDTRDRPWPLLALLPLTVGAAIGAALLRISPPVLLALWLVLGAISAGIVSRAWRTMIHGPDEEPQMPTFTVLSRVDAYVDYVAEVLLYLNTVVPRIRGVRMVDAPPVLRHFTGTFAPLGDALIESEELACQVAR